MSVTKPGQAGRNQQTVLFRHIPLVENMGGLVVVWFVAYNKPDQFLVVRVWWKNVPHHSAILQDRLGGRAPQRLGHRGDNRVRLLLLRLAKFDRVKPER